MPRGNAPFKQRTIEEIARETIRGLYLEAMDATRSGDPRGWGMARIRFDEAADVAGRVENHPDLCPTGTAPAAPVPPDIAGSHTDLHPRIIFVPFPGAGKGAVMAAVISGLIGGCR